MAEKAPLKILETEVRSKRNLTASLGRSTGMAVKAGFLQSTVLKKKKKTNLNV